ncbi:MAG: zinc ribbon domain-containing protein, partial [Planctomycetota bacterium]|nr:zinc ribbon domain-containing protein [Planctomycetota bacterium]
MANKLPDYPGTGLSRQDFAEGKVLLTRGSPKAKYAWDVGVGISHYLDGLRAGEIRGSHCPQCKRTVVPPRAFCEICFSPRVEWRVLKDTGRVNTFSICYVTWDMKRVKKPFIPAVIEID